MDSVEVINLSREELEHEIEAILSGRNPEELLEESIEETPDTPAEDIDTLPKNSPTLLLREETSRFSSAEWYNIIQEMNIAVAGLGGIGSYVAFLIGRMHPNHLVLYDGDIVEEANMSGQLYAENNIGENKSNAMSSIIRRFSNFYNMSSFGMLASDSPITPILICGFDNMTARKAAFTNWKRYIESVEDKSKCLFIDGRLAAEEFQIFCMTGNDTYLMTKYEKEWLFSDDSAENTICSYKQTSYCANMIGSVIVNLLVNFATNRANPLFPRELPFMTRYDATTMMFKTE